MHTLTIKAAAGGRGRAGEANLYWPHFFSSPSLLFAPPLSLSLLSALSLSPFIPKHRFAFIFRPVSSYSFHDFNYFIQLFIPFNFEMYS
jgi:hypothetical protein